MNSSLAFWDYAVIATYLVFALSVGFVLTKKASKDSESYFLGGRSFPWWLMGISMVATSYASDTPLAITEMIREHGVQRIWWFLSAVLPLIFGIFLFSRLWRRAEVTTDAEFYELRYHGKSAAFLRAFRGVHAGIIMNIATMGFVMLAMTSIITTMTDLNEWAAIAVCVSVALVYATFAGFYGVVITDFVQFFIALGSMVYLLFAATGRVGGFDAVVAQIVANPEYGAKTVELFPDFSEMTQEVWALIIFLGVIWWSDANGYNMQRMSACKNERHSILATLFYAIFQSSRAWIWVGVGLVSIVLFPNLVDTPYTDTQAYPMVMNAYLPVGLKGLLVTSFLAAFMSTIDTHLNWGASYIMTDIYRRFIKKEGTERHYMMMTKITVVLLMLAASLLVPLMDSITAVWEFMFLIQAGVGIIMFFRWFWWRVSAFTEITALTVSSCLAFADLIIPMIWPEFSLLGFPLNKLPFEYKVGLATAFIIPVSIVVTLLAPKVPIHKLESFYRRVRPGGFWGVISKEVRDLPGKTLSRRTLLDVLGGILLCYGISLGIGYLVLQKPANAAVCFGLAVVGAVWVYLWYRRETQSMDITHE